MYLWRTFPKCFEALHKKQSGKSNEGGYGSFTKTPFLKRERGFVFMEKKNEKISHVYYLFVTGSSFITRSGGN